MSERDLYKVLLEGLLCWVLAIEREERLLDQQFEQPGTGVDAVGWKERMRVMGHSSSLDFRLTVLLLSPFHWSYRDLTADRQPNPSLFHPFLASLLPSVPSSSLRVLLKCPPKHPNLIVLNPGFKPCSFDC